MEENHISEDVTEDVAEQATEGVFEIAMLPIEDYGALDIVSEYSIYFVPVILFITGYVLMRVFSMRDA